MDKKCQSIGLGSIPVISVTMKKFNNSTESEMNTKKPYKQFKSFNLNSNTK